MGLADQSEIIYIVGGTILALMNGVIGYFLKDAARSLKELSHAIIDLQIAFSTEKAVTASLRSQYDKDQGITEIKLNTHAKRLDLHELDIMILKERSITK